MIWKHDGFHTKLTYLNRGNTLNTIVDRDNNLIWLEVTP